MRATRPARPLLASGLLVVLLPLAACEDEPAPPPPNKPSITGLEAQCRPVQGVYKLDRVELMARDLDGAEDLREPVVIVESTRLPLIAEDLPWEAPADPEVECATASCERVYTWEHSTESLQIFCGADGKLLWVTAEVEDQAGFFERKLAAASAL